VSPPPCLIEGPRPRACPICCGCTMRLFLPSVQINRSPLNGAFFLSNYPIHGGWKGRDLRVCYFGMKPREVFTWTLLKCQCRDLPLYPSPINNVVLLEGREAANTLNKQSRTADKGCSCRSGVVRGANNSSPQEISLLRKGIQLSNSRGHAVA
jgi:hypothetical protein